MVGGNGFLGSHVVDELAALGHEVTVFDRFSSPGTSYTAEGVHRVAGDYLDTAALRAALHGQHFLFHFLSTTTPATSQADPTTDIRTNVAQSVDLFSAAADAGVERVYFASTGGAIYGDQAVDPIPETAVPAPVSPYAIGKQSIEGYLRYFQRTRGLESISLRISNPYGPRQHPGKKQGVIPIFLHRVAEGLPLEVFGDMTMVRDYIFAADAARMIVATVGRDAAHPVYNIGSGHGATLGEIVSLIGATTGAAPETVVLPQPSTFVQSSVLDVGRYTQEFGAQPLVPLAEGIALTWQAMTGAAR